MAQPPIHSSSRFSASLPRTSPRLSDPSRHGFSRAPPFSQRGQLSKAVEGGNWLRKRLCSQPRCGSCPVLASPRTGAKEPERPSMILFFRIYGSSAPQAPDNTKKTGSREKDSVLRAGVKPTTVFSRYVDEVCRSFERCRCWHRFRPQRSPAPSHRQHRQRCRTRTRVLAQTDRGPHRASRCVQTTIRHWQPDWLGCEGQYLWLR